MNKRRLNHLLPAQLAALLLSAGLLVTGCQSSEPSGASAPAEAQALQHSLYYPSEQLGELFRAVQLAPVFEDSKTFVDSRPKVPPEQIVQRYQAQQRDPAFGLEAFVQQHFEPPEATAEAFAPNLTLDMEEHLHSHWDYLTRQPDRPERWSSLIPLPHAYVVPGGRFREIYYWDSYFTMLGLAQSERLDLVEDMLRNFAWLIDQTGRIPNGNRSYYLSRSQPPFFAAMVSLYQTHKGDEAAAEFLPQLEKEYAFWMSGAEQLQPNEASGRVVKMSDGSLLNRYFDDLERPRPESYREDVATASGFAAEERPRVYRDLRAAAESGWDFSSRWFADGKSLSTIQTTQIVPVDLNSLIYHLERTLAALHQRVGNATKADDFAENAARRKAAINRWLWDDNNRYYGDFHLGKQALTGVRSLAMVYPLYFQATTSERAAAVAAQLERDFLMPGGLVTTLSRTGEQWDYPNGWAPLQWLAIRGLKHYGHHLLSERIAARWLNLNRKVYRETGQMMEKYNVVDIDLPAGGGEYPLQDGFGWTNGVALAIAGEMGED